MTWRAWERTYVGYNDEVKRSTQFGLRSLRFALPYKPGHVFTVEPGIYFIPELCCQMEGREEIHGSSSIMKRWRPGLVSEV